MKRILFLILISFVSCQKDSSKMHYDIDTNLIIGLQGKNGEDLLDDTFDFQQIKLKSFGKEGEKTFPFDMTLETVSPETFVIHSAKNEEELNAIELYLLYIHPSSTTIIEWNNGLEPDTLMGKISYNKRKDVFKIDNLFLNGKPIKVVEKNKKRFIIIKK